MATTTSTNTNSQLNLKSTSSIMTNSNNASSLANNEDYLNKKIQFIQNHINNLLIEITNLPEPWTYAVTEDGRVFFINEEEQRTTWLHPKTGQPVSLMIIPPIEDLPNGWQKDYILGLPYLIDHNSKTNYPINILNNLKQQEQLCKMKSSPTNTAAKLAEQTESATSAQSVILSSSSSSSNSSTQSTNGNIIESNTVQVNSAIDSALRKYGWLYKLSQNGLKLWRKRYFVLTDYILDYYSDSTMTKHCGTIFLNNTHSRPTVKKDGSSAFNKKNSFKVELMPDAESESSNNADMFVFLAAESNTSMQEWLNKFNFVSKLKNNSQNRNLYEKRVRSSSNTSTRTNASGNNSNYFIIKHDNSGSKKSSKANSAPSSPNLNSRNSNTNEKKLRSSLSSSSNKLDDKNNTSNKKVIKKKLAFSDDEILNDRPSKSSSKSSSKEKQKDNKSKSQQSDVETENEKKLNNSYNQKYLNDSFENDSKSKHKRSSSLNKSANNTSHKQSNQFGSISSSRSTNSKFGSTNHIYDYKSIYDAFEKPIVEMTKMAQSLMINSQENNSNQSNQEQLSNRTESSGNLFQNYKQLSDSQKNLSQTNQSKSQKTYLDREKINAAAEAAAAASAALEKDKDKSYRDLNQILIKNQSPKHQNLVINNFYQITKSQVESLQKKELDMLIRQLRRNFVLLNHSQQRFCLLYKLYEPYEIIFQHRQNQLNNKNDDSMYMNDLSSILHDSYQNIRDRLKRIEFKMDSIENGLKLAQAQENSNGYNKIYEDPNNMETSNSNKFSSILKLYEYQISEMQHENELLLEDKIIVDKLLDNQFRIFSKYQNLSNEKSLNQQYNALNQEMDLLKVQLSKVNQLLNDTITEKCKHELIYQQQFQSSSQINKSNLSNDSSLYRASLIPIVSNGSNGSNQNSNYMLQNKYNSPTLIHKQNLNQTHSQFSSIDNLVNQQPSQQQRINIPQPKTTYHAHHHQYYLNSNPTSTNNLTSNSKLLNENIISKSIDSIYSPASSTSSSNKINTTSSNGYSAFNSINSKKSNIMTDSNITDLQTSQESFQPVNFTNSRPKVVNQPNTAFQPANKNSNFKRDMIAEKKRSSIGKYPQNYYPQGRDYFQPIQVQHNQSARERLFGNNNNSSSQSQLNENENINNRKIALVKPELRGSCDNDIINRFTQQNQMEYFDADYTEEIVKNIQKPDVYTIPRGNIEFEPEIELNEEEKRAKEKRMIELKKMIAVQTLQQMNIDEGNSNLNHQNKNGIYGSSGLMNQSNGNSSSHYSPDFNFEKEKKAREHLLELRHELAEQIKEKTRQSALNNSNTSPSKIPILINTSSSNSIDINDNRLNEIPKQAEIVRTPNSNSKKYFNEENIYEYCDDSKRIYEHKTYYSVQSVYNNELINSTPTLPTQFKLQSYNSSSILNGNYR